MAKQDKIKKVNQDIKNFLDNNGFENYIEKNNTSTIVVYLNEGTIYNDYSGKTLLNQSIYDYVEDAFKIVDKKIDLNFKFVYSNDVTKIEKENIEKAFKTHYALNLLQCKKIRKELK